MSSENDKILLDTAIKAAKEAGKILKKNFLHTHITSYKNNNTIVTKTDLEADKIIKTIVQGKFPDHKFFSEESGSVDSKSDYQWIVDPLDGTTNFSRGIARFSVAIALCHKEKLHTAVVFDPIQNDLYQAQAGQGAMQNGKSINSTNETPDISKTVISMSRGSSNSSKKRHTEIYKSMTGSARSVRVLNATALDLCAVAAGRLDAHINNDCHLFDCAAGVLVAQEAGAIASQFNGAKISIDLNNSVDLLVATHNLHSNFQEILQNF